VQLILKRIGLVLDIEKDKAIVLTDENEYFYIKLRPQLNLKIGMKTTFTEYDIYRKKALRSSIFKVTSIAASLIMALVIWFITVNTDNLIGSTVNRSVFAYVDVYCNANIELVLDDDFEVMNVRGVNNDGIKLLKELELVDKTYNEAIKEFIEKAIELGYIEDEDVKDFIVLSGALSASNELNKNEKILKTHLDNLTETIYDTDYNYSLIKILKFDSGVRQDSYKNDISMSFYGIYLEGTEQGIEIDLENLETEQEKMKCLNEVNLEENSIYEYHEPEVSIEFDKVSLNEIYNNENLNMKINVVPNIVSEIKVYLDNNLITSFESEPYVVDFNNLESGEHNIRTDLYLINGYKLSEKSKITVIENTEEEEDNEDQNIEENSDNFNEEDNHFNRDKDFDNGNDTPSEKFGEYPEWDSTKIYDTGDIVTYNDTLWIAQWWADGIVPGTTGEYGVWQEYKE
jgi:hypothetical protein